MKKLLSYLLISFLMIACSKQEENKDVPQVKVNVEIASLDQNVANHPYVGQIEENTSTSVSFAVGGTIHSVYVEEGQHVSPGQLIAELDDMTLRTNFKSAEAALTQAKDAHARMKQLYEDKSLPEIQWIEVQTRLQQAQSMYEIAKKNLEDSRLYSPVGGIVGKKIAKAGENTMPGAPVVTFLEIGSIKVNVSVPETEISGIESGTTSTIVVPSIDNRRFIGNKIVKNALSDPLTHTYRVQIYLSNEDNSLLPGMVCNVQFNNSEKTCITVPLSAVRSGSDNARYVWLVKEGIATKQSVVTNEMFGNRIEISDGIAAGDSVIVDGWHKLSNGLKVTVK